MSHMTAFSSSLIEHGSIVKRVKQWRPSERAGTAGTAPVGMVAGRAATNARMVGGIVAMDSGAKVLQ